MDSPKVEFSRDYQEYPGTESRWLCLPWFFVRFVGVAVGLTLAFISLKLDIYADLPWWAVFSPVLVTLCIMLAIMTIAIFVWVYVFVVVFSGGIEPEEECDFCLEKLFRTAKICFLGHGYVNLLSLSAGLLLLKVSHEAWFGLPLVYPMLPLMILGMAHLVLAMLLKQPEVDAPSYGLVGMTLLSQSIMLVVKLDHFRDSKSLPWATTFIPSWLTYTLLLIYCVMSPLQTFHETQAEDGSRSASSANTPYGTDEHERARPSDNLSSQLVKVAGIGSWVIGWAFSQALLTLRLDVFFKLSWLSVMLPAILGWTLLCMFLLGPVGDYFGNVTQIVLGTFRWAPLSDCCKRDIEEAPQETAQEAAAARLAARLAAWEEQEQARESDQLLPKSELPHRYL
jgi:hypothetical protein